MATESNMLKDNIKKELNKTTTENGDVAYKTTFDANLDYFGLVGGMLNQNVAIPLDLFKKAYQENPELAIKNAFYTRDILGGMGFRNIFREELRFLAKDPDIDLASAIPYIVEFGRWDDVLVLLDYQSTRETVAKTIFIQLRFDMNSSSPSLCAKWMPSVNSGKKAKAKAYNLIHAINQYCNASLTPESYRKILSTIRKRLNLTEHYVTTENFQGINYSHVPSLAMYRYNNIFAQKDSEKFLKYLEDLNSSDTDEKIKVNVGTLYPHQIIDNYPFGYWGYRDDKVLNWPLMEAQWKALERGQTDTNTIVVRDGSASMSGLPMQVASALSILFSEQIVGEMKDTFITFSANPEIVELGHVDTLQDKLNILSNHNDVSNTDIMKVYQLLFDATKDLPKEHHIERIVIISDMEFDQANAHHPYKQSTYEHMKQMFSEADMGIPEIVFWNVDARSVDFPTTDIENVKLVSGFSNAILQSILNDTTLSAEEFMLETLSKYDKVIDDMVK